jgi:phage shock protein A
MISQVENHEALVNSAIQDVQEAGARARVQLKKVKQDGENMRRKLAELQDSEQLWGDRALRSADLDEKRAIECVRRKKRAEKEIGELEQQVLQHTRLEKQLTADLATIDDRLNELKRQRNIMRTRQSRAEALAGLRKEDSTVISEIEGIFERWETKVAEYELQAETGTGNTDDLEDEFLSQEEELELKNCLAAMKGNREANAANPK